MQDWCNSLFMQW